MSISHHRQIANVHVVCFTIQLHLSSLPPQRHLAGHPPVHSSCAAPESRANPADGRPRRLSLSLTRLFRFVDLPSGRRVGGIGRWLLLMHEAAGMWVDQATATNKRRRGRALAMPSAGVLTLLHPPVLLVSLNKLAKEARSPTIPFMPICAVGRPGPNIKE
jgi:hypothetical protein